MMKRLILAVATCLAGPAWAEDTRIITDHAGVEVSVPAAPERIVSLHDWTATVMIHELDGALVGSTGRRDKDGSFYIRSGRELYGLTFDDIAMASVHGMLDMEQIAALRPDLIIGNLGDTLSERDQLAQIAPTLMFDPMNGRAPFDNYSDLAVWVDRTDRFSDLRADYDAKIARMRAERPDLAEATYTALAPNPESGAIRVYRNYGALTTVLEDLGMTHGAAMDNVPSNTQEADFSAEVVAQLNTDYIFTTHIADQGESRDTVMAEMASVAPGYENFLPAVEAGRFVSLSRFHVYPTTFAAMDHVVAAIQDMK